MRMYMVIAGLLFSSSAMATTWTDPATGLTWKFNGGYLKGVEGNAEDLVIPSFIDGHKLDAIDSDAFSRREELKSVVISDGFGSIGEFAFDGCSGLSKVSIPDISTSAFSESGLKEIFFEGIPPKISGLQLPEGVSIRYNSEVDFSKIVLAQFGLSNMTPYTPSGSEGRNADCTLIVSNVVVRANL